MQTQPARPHVLLYLYLLTAMVCGLTFWPTQASAQSYLQSFRLDRFSPAPSLNDGLALQLPSTLGHLVPSVHLVLDYAREPLVTSGYGSDPGDVTIVSDRVNAHVAAALGLSERAELFVLVPVTVYQTGDAPIAGGRQFDEPDSAGLQDVSLGGSVRLLGAQSYGTQLGLHAALSLPVGSKDALGSDGGVGARGSLSLAHIFRKVTLGLESGFSYRPERQYGFARIGSEWMYRAGVHVPVGRASNLLFELDGATRVLEGQAFKKDARPLEGLVGARIHLGAGVYTTPAVGVGLLSAPGVPLVRGLLGLGWSPFPVLAREPAKAERVAVAPEPEPEPVKTLDRDADGVADEQDKCPTSAEDTDDFEDDDGCPDDDNDRDGVPDANDTCANAAEDLDGDDDEDGCPETATSAQPATPVTDTSGDGPAPANVHFELNEAGMSQRTRGDLKANLGWFERHPGSYVISVRGHASAEGSEERNQQLSEERAQLVKAWLEKREPWLKQRKVRLTIETEGKGASEPIAPNDTEDGRQKNRRVDFEIRPR